MWIFFVYITITRPRKGNKVTYASSPHGCNNWIINLTKKVEYDLIKVKKKQMILDQKMKILEKNEGQAAI